MVRVRLLGQASTLQRMTDLCIRCECGAVTGVARGVSPATVNRVVCHCRGCTAYAHVLGRASEILDARGGTEVFQMSPRQLSITTGIEVEMPFRT